MLAPHHVPPVSLLPGPAARPACPEGEHGFRPRHSSQEESSPQARIRRPSKDVLCSPFWPSPSQARLSPSWVSPSQTLQTESKPRPQTQPLSVQSKPYSRPTCSLQCVGPWGLQALPCLPRQWQPPLHQAGGFWLHQAGGSWLQQGQRSPQSEPLPWQGQPFFPSSERLRP